MLLLGAEEPGRSSGYTSARHGPYRHGGTGGITGSGSLLLFLYPRGPGVAARSLAGQRRRSGRRLCDGTPADEEAWKSKKSAGEAVEAPWPRHLQHDATPGAFLAYRGLTCRRVWRGGLAVRDGSTEYVRACADEPTRCSGTSTDSHSIGVEPGPSQRQVGKGWKECRQVLRQRTERSGNQQKRVVAK